MSNNDDLRKEDDFECFERLYGFICSLTSKEYENVLEFHLGENAAARCPMHMRRKRERRMATRSQARVMLLPECVLVVRVPVVARLRELAGGRVLDLVGRFDELHAQAFADVPCDVAVETRTVMLVCVRDYMEAMSGKTYSQAPGLFEGNAIAIQPPPGRVAVSRRGGVSQFKTALLGS